MADNQTVPSDDYRRATKRALRTAEAVRQDIVTKAGLDSMARRITNSMERRSFAEPKT